MRKRVFILLLISCLLLPFYLFTQGRGVRLRIKSLDSSYEVGKQYLVLIAINRYQNWRPLYRPVKNAEEIREVIETRYYKSGVYTRIYIQNPMPIYRRSGIHL